MGRAARRRSGRRAAASCSIAARLQNRPRGDAPPLERSQALRGDFLSDAPLHGPLLALVVEIAARCQVEVGASPEAAADSKSASPRLLKANTRDVGAAVNKQWK
eukprot:8958850-Pyramimonas_sp.AAC.1